MTPPWFVVIFSLPLLPSFFNWIRQQSNLNHTFTPGVRSKDLWYDYVVFLWPLLFIKMLVMIMLSWHNNGNGVEKDKVNRCLARYSPRATTTNQPTNRAPNKPARPGPKMTKFGPKLAFLVNLGQAMQAYSMPCCWLVGGCGARAVSRKTPIYFIFSEE